MSVAAKMRPMAEIQITPGKGKSKSFQVSEQTLAKVLSIVQNEEALPYDYAFPHMKDAAKRAASVLRGFRHRDGLSQVELAKKISVTQGDLSKMEAGKRPIGRQIAERLAKIFKTDPRVFR